MDTNSDTDNDCESIEQTMDYLMSKSNIKSSGLKKPKPPKHKYSWKCQNSLLFPWIEYNTQTKEAWFSYPQCEKRCKFVRLLMLTCDRWRYPKLEARLFIQHEKTKKHQKRRCEVKKGQAKLNLSSIPDTLTDDAIWMWIQSVWWLAKEDLAMAKFPSYLEALMVNKGFGPPTSYRDVKTAWEIVEILGSHFRRLLQR